MSRPGPPRLDVGSLSTQFVLTDEHMANIEAACGLVISAVARVALDEALDCFLQSATAETEAPRIADAKDQLEHLGRLATELHELTAAGVSAPSAALRTTLLADLDLFGDAASELHAALGKFLSALPQVQDGVPHRGVVPKRPRLAQLANDLDIIWEVNLGQTRTISGAGKGSLFVCFVEAVTGCLPSHRPWWRGARGRRQSTEAFAKAVARSLDG